MIDLLKNVGNGIKVLLLLPFKLLAFIFTVIYLACILVIYTIKAFFYFLTGHSFRDNDEWQISRRNALSKNTLEQLPNGIIYQTTPKTDEEVH